MGQTGSYVDQMIFGRIAHRRPVLLRLLGEPRESFCKFIAAGQSQPAMLHVKIILDCRWARGSFRQSLAFLRTAKAFADFFAEVLEHGARLLIYRRERGPALRPPGPAQGRGRRWGEFTPRSVDPLLA